jgi:hypothetical protein
VANILSGRELKSRWIASQFMPMLGDTAVVAAGEMKDARLKAGAT